jgi:hypothetical protein
MAFPIHTPHAEEVTRLRKERAIMLAALRKASEQMSAYLDYEQDKEMDAALLAVDRAIDLAAAETD